MGKERRGLAEIVSFCTVTLVVGGVIMAELATGHSVDDKLIAALIGLVLVITGRGVQSSMERGASTEQRNYESSEMRAAAADFRQAAAEVRAERSELQRAHVEIINRLLGSRPEHKE